MLALEIIHRRLLHQRLARPPSAGPADVVAALGAVQAQDFLGSLWALGLRSPGAAEVDVEQAIADRTIVRTWPMRGTLHFVAPADVRWMLALLSPRAIAGSARRNRQLDLDDATFARSRAAWAEALRGGGQSTREEMYGALQSVGVSSAGQRGYHILWRLGQEGLICFGPRRGKQQTFVLLDEWVPPTRTLDRDEALAALTLRYFAGHGPAALRDYVWWSGLSAADARAGVAMVRVQLSVEDVDGTEYWAAPEATAPARRPNDHPGDGSVEVHLLPAFDEYLVGYRDRVALLDPRHAPRVVPGDGGLLLPTILVDGRVAGTWRRTLEKDTVVVTGRPFAAFREATTRGLVAAVERYGRFLGLVAELRIEEAS